MADTLQAVAQAFNIIGLKARNSAQVLERLKAEFGIEASSDSGFLSLRQGSTEMNVAELTQSYFKKYPADFIGHSGEIRYKSDVKDNAAKSRIIADKGFDYWNDLPANEKSPSAANVIKPAIVSTQMKRGEWLQLTYSEKSAAIEGWGATGLNVVQEIMARK